MEIYSFRVDSGRKITQFNSNFIMSRVIQTDKSTHIGCMHIAENGIVGYHQAVIPQLLLVVSGEGYVRSETEEYEKVSAGDAVFWEKDEWHETKTVGGLTAIVIEGEQLQPSLYMPLRSVSKDD